MSLKSEHKKNRFKQYPLRSKSQIASFIFILLFAADGFGAEAEIDNIASLSIEELGNIQITSVSKRAERLADAAASIYVITGDAIQRAGARSLPDALRLAPNLLVAEMSANQFAISARGFNSSIANKLLVMIDGRTIYTPLYSGVFWDAQDVVIQDILRIEVISGPGGTLWGANAVNGVINIITRPSEADAGNLIEVTDGTRGRDVVASRSGSLGSEDGSYRIYAKYNEWDHSVTARGTPKFDAWYHKQTGFRTDWRSGADNITLQGDAYSGAENQRAALRSDFSGANLLARWGRIEPDGSGWQVQSYFDHTTRTVPLGYSEVLNTVDLDVQYALASTGDEKTIIGGGYRISSDEVENSAILAFLPASVNLHWANLYAQQERTLLPKLRLTLGMKVETNDYTGAEFLPDLKLAWKQSDDSLFWGGVSRSVRAPSRLDTNVNSPGHPPFVILTANPNFRSEVASTLELGWRANEAGVFTHSVTLFHSDYDKLRSVEIMPNGVGTIGNRAYGWVEGLEAWGSFQSSPDWSLNAGVLLLNEHFGGAGLTLSPPGNDPHSQFTLGGRFNISESQDINLYYRRVSELSTPVVSAYNSVDVNYRWRVSRGIEIALTGRNLFNPPHQEFFGGSGRAQTYVQQVFEASLTARF